MQIILVNAPSGRGMLVSALAIMLLACSCGPFQSEIDKAAQERVEQHLTRCGDSYVAGSVGPDGQLFLHQWRPAKININPEKLTEVDKQNGIEWKGSVQVGSAMRSGSGENWAADFQPALEIHTPQGSLVKKSGKWELFTFGGSTQVGLVLTGQSLKKVECSVLPKEDK